MASTIEERESFRQRRKLVLDAFTSQKVDSDTWRHYAVLAEFMGISDAVTAALDRLTPDCKIPQLAREGRKSR